jgi:DNA-binding winged helix-turn-helix (wHTH) protein
MDVSGRAGEIPPDARTEHFRIGEWIVYPKQNALVCDGRRVTIEPRAMETLEFLACQAGAVVSPERLLVECWPQLALGDNPVHKAIAQLRKALGDKLDAPRYIETIRKRGYRLIASVTLPVGYRGMVAAAPVFGWSGGWMRSTQPMPQSFLAAAPRSPPYCKRSTCSRATAAPWCCWSVPAAAAKRRCYVRD